MRVNGVIGVLKGRPARGRKVHQDDECHSAPNVGVNPIRFGLQILSSASVGTQACNIARSRIRIVREIKAKQFRAADEWSHAAEKRSINAIALPNPHQTLYTVG